MLSLTIVYISQIDLGGYFIQLMFDFCFSKKTFHTRSIQMKNVRLNKTIYKESESLKKSD